MLLAAAALFPAAATAGASDDATAGARAPDSMGAVVSSDDKPGIGRNPAFVCLRTTLTDQGHTRGTSVIRKSGNAAADRAATRLMQRMKIMDQEGVPHVEREIHVLVKIYGTGAFAYRFFELYENLPDICSAPPWERRRKR